MYSIFSNALSLGRRRSGTKILRGLSPLVPPSQNQVPASSYGLKICYTTTCLRTSGSFFYMVEGRVVSSIVVDTWVCGFAAVGGSPHTLRAGVSIQFETILHNYLYPNFQEFFYNWGMENLLLINLLFQGHQLLHFQDNCCTICHYVNS